MFENILPLNVSRLSISFHSYADDTQLYIAVSVAVDNMSPVTNLHSPLSDIKLRKEKRFSMADLGQN